MISHRLSWLKKNLPFFATVNRGGSRGRSILGIQEVSWKDTRTLADSGAVIDTEGKSCFIYEGDYGMKGYIPKETQRIIFRYC